MTSLIINSDTSFAKVLKVISDLYAAHKYLRITVKTGKDRSLPQNSITHAWYQQIAREFPDDDALGWKCYCKLHHGVPILRSEDDGFRECYDQVIKGLCYEKKLMAMRVWPVTSIMTKVQIAKYMEAVCEDFEGKGVVLKYPDEDLDELCTARLNY